MDGRFCNGLVAVEVFANGLGVPMQGYSFSGATTGYATLVALPLGVLTQVNEYLNNNTVVPTITKVPVVSPVLSIALGNGKADPKALHLIWSGPDDYYLGGMLSMTAYTATANIQQAITSLYNAGARYFFVPTMPDLSLTPSAKLHEKLTPGYIDAAAKVTAQFSVVLTQGLEAMRAKYPDAKIMSFDTLPFMKAEMDKARAAGKNVTESCLEVGSAAHGGVRTSCDNPDDYMFWDNNHPTAEANRILAAAWLKAITYKP
jgi:phospholipase/lecithinase/hemolysin